MPSPTQRRHSSLAQHQRHRKTLTPPLMQLPNLHAYPDWRKRRVPDMLWLSAMVDAYAGDWQASHRILDSLDDFVPRGEDFWDAFVSAIRRAREQATADRPSS
jgi:hypothetical protein